MFGSASSSGNRRLQKRSRVFCDPPRNACTTLAAPDLSYSSRFDLAYNAAHALALAALRRVGYRSENRYLVFQTLPQTIGMPAAKWRILAKAHERRNLAEYEGHLEHDNRLLGELIATADELRQALGSSHEPLTPQKRS